MRRRLFLPALLLRAGLVALIAACASESASTTSTIESTATTATPSGPTGITTTVSLTATTAHPTELTLVAPPDGLIVIEPELIVRGLTSPGAEVTVNGQAAGVSGPDGESSYEAAMTLSEGTNSINVIAEESGSAPTEVSIDVLYMPRASVEFAFFERVSSAQVIVDYAQFLTGQEAIDAAVEDGVTTPEEGVPNDYYIRNVNPMLRDLALDSDVVVILSTNSRAGISEVRVPIDEWLTLFHEDGTAWDLSTETPPEQAPPHFGYFGAGWGAGYWLTIDGLFVVQIRQQWVP